MSSGVELMNLYWTHAGVMPGRGEISRFVFEARVKAAARSGFKGKGIRNTELEQFQSRHRSGT